MRRIALIASLLAGCLQAAPPKLSVVNLMLHERESGGPAIAEGHEYRSGQLLYLSFRIGGYEVKKGRTDKVELRWLVIAVDPEGRLLVPPLNGSVTDELSDNDQNWLPKVELTIPLPGQLPPGAYKVKVHVADEPANASADQELEFKVGGPPMPKVSQLSVLNLSFYHEDAPGVRLDPAEYQRGQMLVARFQVAGFQLGEKNEFDVGYGLAVLDSNGKVLYSRSQAANNAGAPFYPQRLLNGELTLSLTQGVLPAEYTLQVTARDNVGKTSAEAKAKFSVEK